MAEQLRKEIQDHIMTGIIDIETIDNSLRRNYVKRYNTIVLKMARAIQEYGEISKEAVKRNIMKSFILSDIASDRYIKQIIYSDLFDYDGEEEIFRLPEKLKSQDIFEFPLPTKDETETTETGDQQR